MSKKSKSFLFTEPLQCPICKRDMFCHSHDSIEKKARFECPNGHNWYLEYLGTKED